MLSLPTLPFGEVQTKATPQKFLRTPTKRKTPNSESLWLWIIKSTNNFAIRSKSNLNSRVDIFRSISECVNLTHHPSLLNYPLTHPISKFILFNNKTMFHLYSFYQIANNVLLITNSTKTVFYRFEINSFIEIMCYPKFIKCCFINPLRLIMECHIIYFFK